MCFWVEKSLAVLAKKMKTPALPPGCVFPQSRISIRSLVTPCQKKK